MRSHFPTRTSRRDFLLRGGGGFGGIALAGLLQTEGKLGSSSATAASAKHSNPLAAQSPHFAARARRVIYLFMHGGPSQVDLFDPKPELIKYAGQAACPTALGK